MFFLRVLAFLFLFLLTGENKNTRLQMNSPNTNALLSSAALLLQKMPPPHICSVNLPSAQSKDAPLNLPIQPASKLPSHTEFLPSRTCNIG